MVDKSLPNTWSIPQDMLIGDVRTMTKNIRTLQTNEMVEILAIDAKSVFVQSILTGHSERVGHDCIE